MVRSFPLHITQASKLDFRAEWYNVTNHTLFAVASTAVGNSSFGQVTADCNRQPQGRSVLGSHRVLACLTLASHRRGCLNGSLFFMMR